MGKKTHSDRLVGLRVNRNTNTNAIVAPNRNRRKYLIIAMGIFELKIIRKGLEKILDLHVHRKISFLCSVFALRVKISYMCSMNGSVEFGVF
jgi:hypothetical protein